jgi:[acyl-carrier-protein] S-malonyltransferase
MSGSPVRLAFVFPGQGSFRPGTLAAWAGTDAVRVLDEIATRTGRDPRELDRDPTAGERTADAQPAITAASLVAWQAVVDAGIRADVVAGHSLGEVTAAVAAGAIGVGDGAALVAERGRAMGEACAANPGAMAALVKLSPDAVEVLVAEDDELVVANDNAPGQVVVAGTPEAVARIRDRARDAGGRALPLDVEGAFHSPAMASATTPVRAALASTDVTDPDVPLLTATSVQPLHRGEDIATAIAEGILAPVRWRETQAALVELGVRDLVELGPGGVLSGLARRAAPELRTHTVASPEDVAALVDVLEPVAAGR